MVKITIENSIGSVSTIRKDGSLVSCFVDCCRALEVSDEDLKEAFDTIIKEKLNLKDKKDGK